MLEFLETAHQAVQAVIDDPVLAEQVRIRAGKNRNGHLGGEERVVPGVATRIARNEARWYRPGTEW